jgi:hypothetical protein
MENCSIYSHHIWYEEIVNIVTNMTTEGSIEIEGENDSWKSITIFGENTQNKMTLTSQIREFPSFELGDPTDQLTTILNGMRNYFGAITSGNQQLLKKLIHKISSINMEISVVVDKGFNDDFEEIVLTITEILEGFIFSNNNSIFDAPDANNGIFNENADVILCHSGYSDVKDLEVLIEPQYLNQKVVEK